MNKRTYEIIGLRHWDELLRSILIALPLILFGFLLCYFIWGSKKAQARSEKKKESEFAMVDVFGFLGIFIMLVGVFFLFPLLAWIEAVISGVFTFIFVIILILGVIYLVWAWAAGKL
jgi:hypothetical protein